MYEEKFDAYIDAVLSGERNAGEYEIKAVERHLADVAAKKYFFDWKSAERVCRFVEGLKHVKGPEAGNRIKLEPWQVFIIGSLFAWKTAEGFRRFILAYIEVARGNGKSTLLSALALYMLTADGEKGADVYSFATTRAQARIVFNDAQAMARGNAAFLQHFGVKVYANSIVVLSTNSKFQPMSAEGKTLDGLNTHFAIVDELHAHPTRDVFDVVKTSIGKRKQPLMISITTAGTNLAGICMEERRVTQKILDGVIEEDGRFGIIYAADKDDDWKDIETAKKANPNWGVSVQEKTIQLNLNDALVSPSAEKNYKTKHLDIWCESFDQWLPPSLWSACARPVSLEDFAGCDCICGLDLATHSDLTAYVRIFWREELGETHFYLFSEIFLPSAAVKKSRNSQYGGWVTKGLIREMPGEVTDLAAIAQFVIEDAKKFNITAIGYDAWQAEQAAQTIAQETSAQMIQVPMTTRTLSEPMKKIAGLVAAERLHHDGNACLAWQASNVVCKTDANDNIFPRKNRADEKIDAMVAAIMAMRVAINFDVENTAGGEVPITDLFI